MRAADRTAVRPARDVGGRDVRRARRAAAWPAALALLVLAALGLRLWGIGHGLPYVYNADENAHFVPRAVGMFGHAGDPGYFVNPPAFTYVLHAAFRLRWWSRDAVGEAYAADPTEAFLLARLLGALLAAASVGLLAWAGARLLGRAAGLIAGALLAVAFLPVHQAHLALNDAPALAPLCLALVGVAGLVRAPRARRRDLLLAGVGAGLACATKYQAGVVLVAALAAVAPAPRGRPARRRDAGGASGRSPAAVGGGRPDAAAGARDPRRDAAVVLAAAAAAFLLANPYALLDARAFLGDLAHQGATANDGGKLGQEDRPALLYYAETLTWGLGWLPALAAAAGAALLARRDRAAALVLVPAPLVLLAFLAVQDRFFARWLLPAYPLLCLLAAAAVLAAARAAPQRLRPLVAAVLTAALAAQGLVLAVHNDRVLARPDTRDLARAWMVRAIPEGAKIVVEPIAPDQWATDANRPSDVTGNGARWRKWPTSRFRGRIIRLEDYERTLRPRLVERYARAGFCWVVTGSTQYGRADADPGEVPRALRYYAALRARAEVVHRQTPFDPGAAPVPFSYDASFTARSLAYHRPGPEIAILRLRRCEPGAT